MNARNISTGGYAIFVACAIEIANRELNLGLIPTWVLVVGIVAGFCMMMLPLANAERIRALATWMAVVPTGIRKGWFPDLLKLALAVFLMPIAVMLVVQLIYAGLFVGGLLFSWFDVEAAREFARVVMRGLGS
ncbi:MAG: hypothetical protein OXH76_05220 [Boseongicola sp.]|nr:hypothetical protein [Boseongicola sp.]